jgi:hypothetical protein
VAFAVILAAGGLFYIKGRIEAAERNKCNAEQLRAENEVLKANIEQMRLYSEFLAQKQSEKDQFIQNQKKALKNGNEQDGDVAPILRGTLERLRNDRGD